MSVLVATGHRDVPWEHKQLIIDQVRSAVASADAVFVGGARGFDTMVLWEATDAVIAGKRLPVTIVVADTKEQQPAEARHAINRAVGVGANLVELKLPYTAYGLKERNRQMIDLGWEAGPVMLLAYWNGRYKSGTYSAISYYNKSGPPDAQRTVQYIKL